MKKINILFLALLFTSLSFSQIAYLQYRNVPEKVDAKFVDLEAKYWSKVAKAAIAKGQLSGWTLWRKIGVTQTDGPNYVFVNTFKDLKQLDDNGVWSDNLSALGTVKPSDVETSSFTTVTFDYYIQLEDFVDGDYKYCIVNYAKPKDLEAFIEENKTLWKPFHANNIKNGNGMTAWGMASVIYPAGNLDRFTVMTWDGFNKLSDAMEQLKYVPMGEMNSDNPWAEILSKTKMNDILPNGFEYRILYERVMTVE